MGSSNPLLVGEDFMCDFWATVCIILKVSEALCPRREGCGKETGVVVAASETWC